MDEMTDVSNHEQAMAIFQWESEDLNVSEEFLAVYQVPSIDINISCQGYILKDESPSVKLWE